MSQFSQDIDSAYSFSSKSVTLGAAMLDKQVVPDALVKIPLSTLNRHGLVTGATGTGKTKSLQYLCEQLSSNGIPVLMMDVKGDVSGISQPGILNDAIRSRMDTIWLPREPKQFPIEFLTLNNEPGLNVRATVSEMGPILMTKLLELNDTQGSVLSIIFKYCDDNKLLLINLDDLKKVILYLGVHNNELTAQYGQIADATLSVITRSILELEGHGGADLFGEPSLDIHDLMRTNSNGLGMINILKTTDIFLKPKLYTSFILSLLAELFNVLPEVGDLPQPKFVMIIDEAHLLFEDMDNQIMDHITAIIKLIRSKGVGIIFCTQSPNDIPELILGQLGLKIQHALRTFTPKDVKAIKLVAETFPISDYYDVEKLITELGIGEALITCINEKWYPSMLAHTMIVSPSSRMWPTTEQEVQNITNQSLLVGKYEQTIDPVSAADMLAQKLQSESDNNANNTESNEWTGFFKRIFDNQIVKTMGNYAVKELARWALGKLGVSWTMKTAWTNMIGSIFGKLMK